MSIGPILSPSDFEALRVVVMSIIEHEEVLGRGFSGQLRGHHVLGNVLIGRRIPFDSDGTRLHPGTWCRVESFVLAKGGDGVVYAVGSPYGGKAELDLSAAVIVMASHINPGVDHVDVAASQIIAITRQHVTPARTSPTCRFLRIT